MNHLFMRHNHSPFPTVVSGQGCYLTDRDGKQYFDGSGGAAISCVGHGDEEVIAAVKDQLDRIAFAHTSFFSSEPASQLADLLVEQAPGDISRVYFVSGGSEANEAALKLARQYFLEIGESDRRHVISRRQSYHGATLGALTAGGEMWRRLPFQPMLGNSTHISPCYAYRGQGEGESPEAYGQRVADELESEIQRLGPESVMAFIAEPVAGAALGAVPPVKGYFTRIRKICDRYGVLLILDEVMCGTGRTGSFFACEQEGIAPDMVTLAKGLGAGYQPIGAMLCTAAIHDAVSAGTGFFKHGHSYLAHPTACAAGLAVCRALLGRDLIRRARDLGAELAAELDRAFGQHPHIGDLRGRGMFRGLEIVRDRATKEPFDPALNIHSRFKAAAFEAGLVCYPMGGTADGRKGDHVMLAPPFIMKRTQIDELTGKLMTALDGALAGAA